MKIPAMLLVVVGLSVAGCNGEPLFPLASNYPWKCVSRDGKGDLFFGIDEDQAVAIGEAQRQCLAGSSIKHSCRQQSAYCEQLPPID
jgi:hypothetical protein